MVIAAAVWTREKHFEGKEDNHKSFNEIDKSMSPLPFFSHKVLHEKEKK